MLCYVNIRIWNTHKSCPFMEMSKSTFAFHNDFGETQIDLNYRSAFTWWTHAQYHKHIVCDHMIMRKQESVRKNLLKHNRPAYTCLITNTLQLCSHLLVQILRKQERADLHVSINHTGTSKLKSFTVRPAFSSHTKDVKTVAAYKGGCLFRSVYIVKLIWRRNNLAVNRRWLLKPGGY